MRLKFAVSALYIDTCFQGNCDKKRPHKKFSLAKKAKWQCCLTIVHNYLKNELLKLAFISVSYFYCCIESA